MKPRAYAAFAAFEFVGAAKTRKDAEALMEDTIAASKARMRFLDWIGGIERPIGKREWKREEAKAYKAEGCVVIPLDHAEPAFVHTPGNT